MKKEERYKGVLDWFEANVPVQKRNFITTIRTNCLLP